MTKAITEMGISIEQRTSDKGSGVDRTEQFESGDLTFSAARHHDGVVNVSISKFGGAFASFSMHLTPAQAQAFGHMLARLAVRS